MYNQNLSVFYLAIVVVLRLQRPVTVGPLLLLHFSLSKLHIYLTYLNVISIGVCSIPMVQPIETTTFQIGRKTYMKTRSC